MLAPSLETAPGVKDAADARPSVVSARRWISQSGILILFFLAFAVAAVFWSYWKHSQAAGQVAITTSDLQIAVRSDPKNGEIHTQLAERFLFEERAEDALREASTAVALAPNSSRAHYLYAKALQRAQKGPQALKALQRALELDAGNAPAHFLLGHYHYWHEQPAKAVKEFQTYVEQQPGDDIGYRFLGLAHLRMGDLKGAESALAKAVELGQDSSGNHQALGNFYLNRAESRQDNERAATELVRAVELNPNAAGNRLEAAAALQRVDKLPEAAAQYEAVFAHTPTDDKICYALLQIYTRLSDAPRIARYRELYRKITLAREAKQAVTAGAPGMPSKPQD